jgi:hypothetical protein
MNGFATRFGKHAAMIQLIADQLRQLPGDGASGIEPRLLAKSLEHIAADLISASVEPDRPGQTFEAAPEPQLDLLHIGR